MTMTKMPWRVLIGLLFCLTMAAPARATPIDKQVANSFFAKCTASRDTRMAQDTQEAFCACTAAQMMNLMTAEDIQLTGENTSQGLRALNRMLVDVYAPCMSDSVSDMAYTLCQQDPRAAIADETVGRQPLCTCMAQRTNEWFSMAGKEIMARILATAPYRSDPLSSVMESAIYKKETYEIMLGCVTELQNSESGKKRKP
jgi:hypothetical protein